MYMADVHNKCASVTPFPDRQIRGTKVGAC